MDKKEFQAFILLAIIFFVMACFINSTFNPLLWGTFTKVIYCLGAAVTVVNLSDF